MLFLDLGAFPFSDSHTDTHVLCYVEGSETCNGILADYNIKNIPHSYVTDTIFNCKSAISNSDNMWVPCFTHTLHSAVSRSFKVDQVSQVMTRL